MRGPSGPTPQVSYDDLDEATVVARAQDGDLQAFENLVDRYQAPLFRLAVRTLKDRAQAEDVVQDSLLTVWRKLPTLQDPAAFRAWVYRLVTTRCLDALRRRKPREPFSHQLDEQVAAEPVRGTVSTTDPAAAVEQRQQWRELQRALDALPADQRVCWVLKEIEGLSYEEIAEVLTIPPSTVRGRLARARQQLAERMASWR